jgi:hypothetical protein
VCRNLARIAASVCQIWLDIPAQEHLHPLEPGAISFLLKTASHPSTNICGLTLPVLSQVSSTDPHVAQQLLPVLQRRAIVPHRVESGRMSLADLSDGDFHTFQQFRDHELTGALLACWRANSDNYMDSCTSAVEEFCSDHASVNVSLHLEAALYCIESVAADEGDSQVHFRHSKQLARCLMALSRKSTSMMANPLTLARMCTFLRKVSPILLPFTCFYSLTTNSIFCFIQYSRWCLSEDQPDGLVVAADIVTSTFRLLLSSVPDRHSQEMLRETSISPVSEAVLTIQELLCRYPTHFISAEALALLNGKETPTNQYTPCYPNLIQFLLINWQPCGRIRMLPEVTTIRSIPMSSYHSALESVTCWHLCPKTKGSTPFRRWCHLHCGIWSTRLQPQKPVSHRILLRYYRK